jgi:hypothetical protein
VFSRDWKASLLPLTVPLTPRLVDVVFEMAETGSWISFHTPDRAPVALLPRNVELHWGWVA